MVRLYSIIILKEVDNDQKIISNFIYGEGSWKFLMYSSYIKEICFALSKNFAGKVNTGCNEKFEKDDYVLYINKFLNGITYIIVTDIQYPSRVVLDINRKVVNNFSEYVKDNYDINYIKNLDMSSFNKSLKDMGEQYQYPEKMDKILALHKNIDETKLILHKSLDTLMKRGETLDDLIEKSESISLTAKDFYRTTKRAKCCYIF